MTGCYFNNALRESEGIMTDNNARSVAPPFEGWRLCGHCEGHGTCHSGAENTSCFVCTKSAGITNQDKTYRGLPCSICHGHGCGAPTEVKTNRLMGAYVTFACSAGVFIIIIMSGFFFAEHLDKILTFGGTVIGSITGFYFGGRKTSIETP